MSKFCLLVIITTPCSILQNHLLLHLDGQDLPQVKKTHINTNGINADIITKPLEAIICSAMDIIPHKD